MLKILIKRKGDNMSQDNNTTLLELASEHISFWAGEGIGKVLELDVATGDYDKLNEDIRTSAAIMHQLNYQNDDPMTPERAEDMYREANDVI